MIVRPMGAMDIEILAAIHRESFPTDGENSGASLLWVLSNWMARPRSTYFVIEENGAVLGYILWVEQGGFRKEAVLELEQVAVKPSARGRGAAAILIQESLREVKRALLTQGREVKLIKVTTGASSEAQNLYRRALGAEVVAVIRDLYEGDEVIMVARPV